MKYRMFSLDQIELCICKLIKIHRGYSDKLSGERATDDQWYRCFVFFLSFRLSYNSWTITFVGTRKKVCSNSVGFTVVVVFGSIWTISTKGRILVENECTIEWLDIRWRILVSSVFVGFDKKMKVMSSASLQIICSFECHFHHSTKSADSRTKPVECVHCSNEFNYNNSMRYRLLTSTNWVASQICY